MKITTQRKISGALGVDPALLSKVLKGKKRLTAQKAAKIEHETGIDIRILLFGNPEEIRAELEKVYGQINFKRGRCPVIKEVNQ